LLKEKINTSCRVVIELDKVEKYLASISMSLEVIAHELKQMNKKPNPPVNQQNSQRELKHKVTK
jgi:hypothetical protein